MDLGLKGKVALVSGGTRGLGRAIAEALAHEQCHVAIGGRDARTAADVATSIPGASGVQLDLNEPATIAAAVSTLSERYGAVDVLVVNGGGPPPSTADEVTAAAERSAASLLVNGPTELVRACLPAMRARRWGRIVAVGSSAVVQPIPNLATSSMFRLAFASYLKLLADAVATDGVTVNMVLPGRIETDRTLELDTARAKATGLSVTEVRGESERLIPMRRYGTPQEFAATVTYLCGAPASYVTGTQVRVDGGMVRAL